MNKSIYIFLNLIWMKIMIFYYQLIKSFWIFLKSYLNLLTKIKYKKNHDLNWFNSLYFFNFS